MRLPLLSLSGAALLLLLQACGDRADAGLGPACSGGLDAAATELEQARVDGFSDSVKWSQAASLIAAARVQEGFGEYQNCVIKARDARRLIREVRG